MREESAVQLNVIAIGATVDPVALYLERLHTKRLVDGFAGARELQVLSSICQHHERDLVSGNESASRDRRDSPGPLSEPALGSCFTSIPQRPYEPGCLCNARFLAPRCPNRVDDHGSAGRRSFLLLQRLLQVLHVICSAGRVSSLSPATSITAARHRVAFRCRACKAVATRRR